MYYCTCATEMSLPPDQCHIFFFQIIIENSWITMQVRENPRESYNIGKFPDGLPPSDLKSLLWIFPDCPV